ncbi:MAG TPA: hypothetical protein VHS78_07795 [Candidatus Elarobacter sp.]|nr:hypothetical protein [Candidatus Elarobacter sp.]
MQPASETSRAAVAVVDTIADEFGGRVAAAPADAHVVVTGWALDDGAAAFERVEIEIGGAHASAAFGERRPDVATVYGSPETVGFRLELGLGGAALGHHVLALTGVRANGERVAIPVAVSFDVVAAQRALPPGVREGGMQGAVDEVRPEGRPGDAGQVPARVVLDGTLIVRGWAASPANVPAAHAYAEIDGIRLFRGMAGHERPDVATALGTERADYGFRIRIPAYELGAGHHTVRVIAVAEGAAGPVGEPFAVAVDPRPPAAVYPRGERLRGRIDLVGRLEGETTIREERTHLLLAPGERAVLTGWSGDPVRGTLPDRLVLTVDGVAHGTVQRGIEREDVVTATDAPGLARSGFSAVIRADRLGAGFHRAELIAFFADAPAVLDALSFEVTS